jgi:hypothetical protein
MTAGTDPPDNGCNTVLTFQKEFHLPDGNHVKRIGFITFPMDNSTLRHVTDRQMRDDFTQLLLIEILKQERVLEMLLDYFRCHLTDFYLTNALVP